MLSWLEQHMLPCAYKAIFGIECPICGSQRSLVELLKGNFVKSFSLYPPLVPVLALVIIFFVHLINKNLIKTGTVKVYSVITLMVILINYITKFFLN